MIDKNKNANLRKKKEEKFFFPEEETQIDSLNNRFF